MCKYQQNFCDHELAPMHNTDVAFMPLLQCSIGLCAYLVFVLICNHCAVKGHSAEVDYNQTLRTFKLFRRLYAYNPGQGTFQPVPAMPPHLPQQICTALKTLRLVNTAGADSSFTPCQLAF